MPETAGNLALVAGQSLIIYVFLVLAVARLGRPMMAGLTAYQYLIVALLGSAVETGLYRGSDSLWAGLVSAATILLANYLMCMLCTRHRRLRRFLVGGPLVLVHEGAILWPNLRRVFLTERDLQAAIRRRGFENLDEIRLAVMEVDGEVGVIAKEPDKKAR